MTSDAVVSYDNVIRRAGSQVLVSTEVGNMSGSRLADPRVGYPWRGSATTWTVDFDAGASTAIGWVGLFGCNLAATDTIQITAGATQGDDAAHDSGAINPDVDTLYGSLAYLVGSADVSARWVRIAGTTAAAPQAGAGWAGPTLRFGRNLIFPVRVAPVDNAIKHRTVGGQVIGRAGARQRRARFAWEKLSAADAIDGALRLLGPLFGAGENVVVDATPWLSGTTRHERLIYGEMQRFEDVSWDNPGGHGFALEMLEAT